MQACELGSAYSGDQSLKSSSGGAFTWSSLRWFQLVAVQIRRVPLLLLCNCMLFIYPHETKKQEMLSSKFVICFFVDSSLHLLAAGSQQVDQLLHDGDGGSLRHCLPLVVASINLVTHTCTHAHTHTHTYNAKLDKSVE